MHTGCRTTLAAVAVVAAVAGLAACTTPRTTTSPARSALSGGALTCGEPSAACGRSGALRWVLPLTGTYRVDRPDDLHTDSVVPAEHDDGGDGLSLLAMGDTVYLQAGGQVLAVDVATGRVRWRHVAPDASSYPAETVGDRLLYQLKLPGVTDGPYVSLDPRTGAARTIPVRDGEYRVDALDTGMYLARGLGRFSTADQAGVRKVDPLTGRTVWETRLRTGHDYIVSRGIFYADDSRERANLPKKLRDRWQTRAIQRVDLRTGKRLPDIQVPKRYWDGDYYLDYVTRRGVVVLVTSPADGAKRHALTLAGRPVRAVPTHDQELKVEARGHVVNLAGRPGRVRRLTGHGWAGPAMRAPAYDTNRLVGSRVRVAVAVACAPDGVRPGTLEDPFPATYCTKPRFFGVTW